jgi:DNA-binding transcriptional LysR family regulator
MPRFNLTNFETVCTISKLGTFSAAALRLNASQPAVTSRVRELESSVGIRFFQKRGRRMELTVEGREFIRRVEPLLHRIEQELDGYREPGALRGVVRMGIPHVTLAWFPQLVGQLQARMPQVRFEIDVDVGLSMLRKLEAGRLDLAIVAGGPPPAGMDAVSLSPEESQWLMSSRVPRRRGGAALPLAELLGSVPLWLVPRTSVLFPLAMAALHGHRDTFDNLNACTHMLAILELVHRTGGIGLAASAGAQAYLAAGLVEPVSPQLPPIRLDITLLCHHDERQPVVRQTLQHIVAFDALRRSSGEHFAEQAGTLRGGRQQEGAVAAAGDEARAPAHDGA